MRCNRNLTTTRPGNASVVFTEVADKPRDFRRFTPNEGTTQLLPLTTATLARPERSAIPANARAEQRRLARHLTNVIQVEPAIRQRAFAQIQRSPITRNAPIVIFASLTNPAKTACAQDLKSIAVIQGPAPPNLHAFQPPAYVPRLKLSTRDKLAVLAAIAGLASTVIATGESRLHLTTQLKAGTFPSSIYELLMPFGIPLWLK